MKLLKLEVNACGGISPEAPVVIDFTQSKYVAISGDMGTGKSSLETALLVGLGQLSKEDKNLVNLDSGKLDINLDFVGKDKLTYKVRVTKSEFRLIYEGEKLDEPITKMKQLLGVAGVSPMSIKTAKLSEIIKWLASYSNKTAEEFENQRKKLKDGMKKAADARADANRSLKSLNEYLSNEEMYAQWEESEKKYAVKPDIEELSRQLETATEDKETLRQMELLVVSKKEKIKAVDEMILKLERERIQLKESIDNHTTYITEHAEVPAEYERINTRYKSAATDLANFNKWQEIKQKKSDRDQFETLSQQADAKEKELKKEMKELQAEILPDIKNVELVMEDTHEDGKMVKEGLYWEGRNVAQLSESEWFAIVLQIWRKYKVRIVVIDNFQSLGTKAVEIIEKLIKDGAYVLAAEMKRGTQTLEIEYK
jgi:hypothetical protein